MVWYKSVRVMRETRRSLSGTPLGTAAPFRSGFRMSALICICNVLLVALLALPALGGEDVSTAIAGEFEFRINCAFCHGLGARGGGRGPDLTRPRKRHGDTDADLFRNISIGIPGTSMPATGTNGQGVGMTEEEIWSIVAYLRSIQLKVPEQPVGDASRGEKLFCGDASCSSCHMIAGKGGRLGPDLSSVATTRTISYLEESVRNPSRRLAARMTEATKEFAQEYETVTVVIPNGREVRGVTLNEDDVHASDDGYGGAGLLLQQGEGTLYQKEP